MEVLESGTGEVYLQDPDDVRAWMAEHKSRALIDKLMTEQEAVSRFVSDGDYVSYDLSSMVRGPISLQREIVRQQKKDLWLAALFTLLDSTILVAGGCVTKLDVGFAGLGKTLFDAISAGEVKVIDWSNGALALRHLAGAMGVPFLVIRSLAGTDTFKRSGAKQIKCPFTGKKLTAVPAINPDVALIHVNQADKHGNCRVFGPGVTPRETAAASKKVIVSAEEIIDTEEIRKNPGLTTIPYYIVNAVVHAPFGGHPGTVPGHYNADAEHLDMIIGARTKEDMQKYLDKYVYGVKNHGEYLELIGDERMARLREEETIKEGYHA
jgi:acyl CoA:acetate/3-ketoacid CoA transferase alpha subunit